MFNDDIRNEVFFSAELIKAYFKKQPIPDIIAELESPDLCSLTKQGDDGIDFLRCLLEDAVFSVNRQSITKRITAYLRFIKNYNNIQSDEITIYDVLCFFCDKVIYRTNNQYRYRYNYTDIWNNLSKELSEELFIATAVVQDSKRRRLDTLPTDWNYCISSDNIDIQNMLSRDVGVSENHFHLRGSTPYFDVAWIHVMNAPNKKSYEASLMKMSANLLKRDDTQDKVEPLWLMLKKASAIRLFLYSIVSDDNYLFEDGYINSLDYENDRAVFGIVDDRRFNIGKIAIKQLRHNYMKSEKLYKRYKNICADAMYAWLISQVIPCYTNYSNVWDTLQENIVKRNIVSDEMIDYAQNAAYYTNKYYNIQGERFILNSCLDIIYTKSNGYKQIQSLLYLYLAIKYQFYDEMVQSNSRKGFFNFNEYQDRKDLFLPWSYSLERKLTVDTICSIIDDVKIHSVELRISPQIDVIENVNMLKNYDFAIEEAIRRCNRNEHSNFRPKVTDFYYVFHFIKIADNEYSENKCRNYKSRVRSLAQAHSIIKIKEYSYKIAKRIRGIDACASELDCRPDVFGSTFRLVQYYADTILKQSNIELPQLRATYHVGEDNYDILDSLRAISEAILFLQLAPGSRLGHATYLGIDAKKYYELNGYSISLPKQVWLDNVVWLYYFIKENDVNFDGKDSCLFFLKEEFMKCFFEIYGNKLNEFFISCLCEKIPPYIYSYKPQTLNECHFDMESYFYSWLLRGDDPDLYSEGYYKKYNFFGDGYRICTSESRMSESRRRFEPCCLYYLYHFNKEVKEIGDISISINVPDFLVNAITCSQKRLLEIISEKSIAVECNPTSNLKISTMSSYNEHPLINFYHNGLEANNQDKPLNVSINTDDKSVFSTSLSNEYTYLLFYLEQEKNSDGSKRYSRYELLKWLNEIRMMGNEQSFSSGITRSGFLENWRSADSTGYSATDKDTLP